ncbi:MAG: tRNA pseudouridine(13) synthase TruD [Candidatus Aminicenantes bacterium]|nr:tRNA pseudouridine(13) synthase TruD [Candidatus Aminicenantes bacterium]
MIKVKPEEFRVIEKANLSLSPSGAYRVYRLTKKRLTTEEACRRLAQYLKCPLSNISWGGRKDKHGFTTQYITIYQGQDISLEEKNLQLEPIGFMERPMGPDLIEGNYFEITMRGLKEIDSVLKAIEEVKTSGFANYFDDQRFRSYDPQRGFFAEKILLRHYNGALKIYLTSITPSLKKKERERRLAFLTNWKNWEKCLDLARKPEEKKIFSFLAKNPNKSELALQLIPPPEVAFLYAAYQAHLWNELLRRLIKFKGVALAKVAGREGEYLFWQLTNEKEKNYFLNLKLPTAARQMEFPDDLTKKLFFEILKEKNLVLSAFRTKVLRLISFRSYLRPAASFPINLRILEISEDELHLGQKKLSLSFELARGSYATMLLKRLTLQKGNTNLCWPTNDSE